MPDMSPQYEFRLVPMSSARSRAGAPGEMIEWYKLPANDKAQDVIFVFLNGVASFVDFKEEDKNLKPEGTQGWFLAHGSRLMLETNARVCVESPPSDGLPSNFDRTYLPSSSTKPKIPRCIYLRHGDTVHFEEHSCAVHVSVTRVSKSVNTSFAEGDKAAAATEIQVKSSAHAPFTSGASPAGPADETEDEDDLDGPIHTPLGAEDSTPATSRPTDDLAVKDTPSRPFSREGNDIYSTARENGLHNDGTDGSTPAARAAASRGKTAKVNPSGDAESQFVFNESKRQTKYGGTPKPKRRTKNEIIESPSKSDLPSEPHEAIVVPRPRRLSSHVNVDVNGAISMSSPNRKRTFSESDEEEDMAPPASTAPLTKKARGRGRPPKEPEAVKPIPTKSGKKRGRPSKGSRGEDDQDEAVEPPSSTGKLKRPSRKSEANEPEEEDDDGEVAETPRRTNAPPDRDPRASSTPQSSAPHGSGKAAPTKVLLSNSKYAEDSKAKNWLKKHGASVDEKIPGKRSNFVCVVAVGELLTTPKVLRSVALGKRVVTDQWIKLSMEQNQLLDLDDYVHDDLAPTMSVDRSKLLQGKALFITSALEKVYGDSFAHLKELAAAVGAHRVEVGTAKKTSGFSDAATIFLGRDGDDPDAKQLVEEDGRAVYQKNLLTQSILRGELLLEHDEFKWSSKSGKGKKGKK
ncbi:hypothetical protein MBLNU13_g07234t1 [Cladosporium sp. NU13]